MKTMKILVVFLTFIAGVAAETCYGATSNLYCMFGCCSDAFFIYCCLSNGAGIGIIVAALVVIISIILICIRRHRHHAAHCQTACPPTVTHVTSSGFTNMGYAQPPPNAGTYGQPPPPYHS